MSVDIRPPWMTPIVYNDEAPAPPRPALANESPIDYSRKAEREKAFDEDLDDETEEGGDES